MDAEGYNSSRDTAVAEAALADHWALAVRGARFGIFPFQLFGRGSLWHIGGPFYFKSVRRLGATTGKQLCLTKPLDTL